jgi:hypothetical protein
MAINLNFLGTIRRHLLGMHSYKMERYVIYVDMWQYMHQQTHYTSPYSYSYYKSCLMAEKTNTPVAWRY